MTKEEAIKYLRQIYPNGGHCWLDEQRIEAIGMAIKELQEEPENELLNTESMIESYKQRLISQVNGVKNNPLVDMCLVSYKHGINDTLDTLNLSNVQTTVKDWKEEPISEDFKEVIEEYATKRLRDPELCLEYIYFELINAVKYGVNLQKEQMMKRAVEAKVYNKAYPTEFEIETNTFMQKLKHGDNVKLIIIKED